MANTQPTPGVSFSVPRLFSAYADLLEEKNRAAFANMKVRNKLAVTRARLRRDLEVLERDSARQAARLAVRGVSGSAQEALEQDKRQGLTHILVSEAQAQSEAELAQLKNNARRRRSFMDALTGLWG